MPVIFPAYPHNDNYAADIYQAEAEAIMSSGFQKRSEYYYNYDSTIDPWLRTLWIICGLSILLPLLVGLIFGIVICIRRRKRLAMLKDASGGILGALDEKELKRKAKSVAGTGVGGVMPLYSGAAADGGPIGMAAPSAGNAVGGGPINMPAPSAGNVLGGAGTRPGVGSGS